MEGSRIEGIISKMDKFLSWYFLESSVATLEQSRMMSKAVALVLQREEVYKEKKVLAILAWPLYIICTEVLVVEKSSWQSL